MDTTRTLWLRRVFPRTLINLTIEMNAHCSPLVVIVIRRGGRLIKPLYRSIDNSLFRQFFKRYGFRIDLRDEINYKRGVS